MTFRASVLDEPLLEFGGNGREIDIRLGLMRHGPLEPERASRVRLGIIGTNETIEGFGRFLDRCRIGIDAKSSRQPNLFLPFPGLANDNPFQCSFELDAHARKPIPRSDIARIVAITSTPGAIEEAVALFTAQAQAIAESPGPPDVIVCALPLELITRVVHGTGVAHQEEGDEDQPDDEAATPDFRDLLKARTIHLKRPLQLAWPTTWDDTSKVARELSKLSGRQTQDPATRAWNLFGGLYYKAGHVPWRLPRDPAQFDTSYVGISFYRDHSGQRLLTSTAQMFDERGQGLILRGGRACTDKHNRRPREDAYDLLQRSLQAYSAHHFHAPARVIVYKTSPFQPEEIGRVRRNLAGMEDPPLRLCLGGRRRTIPPLPRRRLSALARYLPRIRARCFTLLPRQRPVLPHLSRAVCTEAADAPALSSRRIHIDRSQPRDPRPLKNELEFHPIRRVLAHYNPGRARCWPCAQTRLRRYIGGRRIPKLYLI
jgi:hypothetical protein